MRRTSLVLGLTVAWSIGAAQSIPDRATLNAMLASSTTDDFESFVIGDGAATGTGGFSLDSTTVVLGQGPGLVNPGATYLDPSQGGLQWNGNGYFSIATKTILSNGTTGQITISYQVFTQAMGVDVKVFNGFGYDGSLQVFNGATLVDTVNFSLAGNGGESVFVGYRNDAGITHVMLSDFDHSWSPIIDDHTYGVVPEPASCIALGLGAMALGLKRRRKSS